MIAIFAEYPDGERGEFNKKPFTFTGECESVNRGYSLSPFTRGGGRDSESFSPRRSHYPKGGAQ